MSALCLLLASMCVSEWQTLHQRKIVVYNVHGLHHAESVNGQYWSVLTGSNPADPRISYASLPTQIGYRAWRRDVNTPPGDIHSINGKRVVFPGNQLAGTEFVADVVIIDHVSDATLPVIVRTFKPGLVIASSTSRGCDATALAAQAAALGTKIHIAATDGAYVIE